MKTSKIARTRIILEKAIVSVVWCIVVFVLGTALCHFLRWVNLSLLDRYFVERTEPFVSVLSAGIILLVCCMGVVNILKASSEKDE